MSNVLFLEPLDCPFCAASLRSFEHLSAHIEYSHPLGAEAAWSLEQAEGLWLRLQGLDRDEFEAVSAGPCGSCSRCARRRYLSGPAELCCRCLIRVRTVEVAA